MPANDDVRDPGWHQLPTTSVLGQLASEAQGLTRVEAHRRLQQFGPNELPAGKTRSAALRFALQFHNILIYVLLGSALITATLRHWMDTLVILAVVLANAIIGFVQEGKAEKAMNAIRRMLAPQAAVVRDGERITVAGNELVPGDIVLVEAGDKVPADLRLMQVFGLQAQEAILTGESLPVEKGTDPVAMDAPIGDRACMAFSGTMVTAGQGHGVVVATGARTEIGRISGMLAQVETLTTPLVRQMDAFARWLTLLILLVAAVLLVFGYFVEHHSFAEVFMAVVGLSVAAIPEGLPAVLTITLAIGVHAMARRNAIVRRLPAIETVGAVSVICTDKTGTLTRNEMSVTTVLLAQGPLSVGGVGYAPHGNLTRGSGRVAPADVPVLHDLGMAAALCNDASLREQDGDWRVEGDPMEGALLALSGKCGFALQTMRVHWSRTDAIPFDPKHRFMATLYHDHAGRGFILVKGAPERILDMCRDQFHDCALVQPLDRDYWLRKSDQVARLGQRVLALALRPVQPSHTVLEQADIDGQLTLLGMVGLMDPPRPEAVTAVAECHAAGIRVKMITGDHAGTAAAIGRLVGLAHTDKVLTGADLDAMDDARLASEVLTTDVFARTSPAHKLRLVTALQSHGMTVAMTGDGVNDAPALKRADAGIAMGLKGSEAAKEAAVLVLADDNFASIVAAVREGRTVYDNIKKVISWTLPTNAGEAATIMIALLFGMALPVTPIQILWINLITSVTLGMALAFEPTEENTMRRPPRRRGESLLAGGLVWHIILVAILFTCGVFGIFAFAMDRGYSVELARTLALNTLVVMEIFHLFFIRNVYGTSLTWQAVRGTRVVWITVTIITLAQLLVTYLPQLQDIFGTRSVSMADGLIVLGIGVAFFALVEIEKQIRLRLAQAW